MVKTSSARGVIPLILTFGSPPEIGAQRGPTGIPRSIFPYLCAFRNHTESTIPLRILTKNRIPRFFRPPYARRRPKHLSFRFLSCFPSFAPSFLSLSPFLSFFLSCFLSCMLAFFLSFCLSCCLSFWFSFLPLLSVFFYVSLLTFLLSCNLASLFFVPRWGAIPGA